MARGFSDNSDPNAKPNEFPTVPAGTYVVNDIEVLVGESNFPEFRTTKSGDSRVAYTHLLTTDGKWQIFYAADKLSLLLLAKAFGCKIKALSNLEETEFLLKVEEAIHKSGDEVKVIVNEKGFVSAIPDALPPQGIYTWKFAGARSNDGTEPVTFQTHNFAKDKDGNPDPDKFALWMRFRIAGDASGNPTIYNGYTTSVRFYQPFDGAENGAPRLRVNPNRSKPTAVQRLERLINLYCPDLWEYEWNNDPLSSSYGIDETLNPMVVIVDHLNKSNRTALGMFGKKQKSENFGIDILTLTSNVSDEEEEDEEPEDEVQEAEWIFGAAHPQLAAFCDWMNEQAGGSAFVEYPPKSLDALKLSDSGKTWAASNLQDIWTKAGLTPGLRAIASITEEEAEKLLVAAGVYRAEEKTEFPFN